MGKLTTRFGAPSTQVVGAEGRIMSRRLVAQGTVPVPALIFGLILKKRLAHNDVIGIVLIRAFFAICANSWC